MYKNNYKVSNILFLQHVQSRPMCPRTQDFASKLYDSCQSFHRQLLFAASSTIFLWKHHKKSWQKRQYMYWLLKASEYSLVMFLANILLAGESAHSQEKAIKGRLKAWFQSSKLENLNFGISITQWTKQWWTSGFPTF